MEDYSVGWALFLTVIAVAAFRGLLDLIFHRFIAWPSLFGVDSEKLREEDVVARRRVWFWRYWYRIAFAVLLVVVALYLVQVLAHGAGSTTLVDTAQDTFSWVWNHVLTSPTFWAQVAILPLFFLINFVIFFGPLMGMGVSQIRGFEPVTRTGA